LLVASLSMRVSFSSRLCPSWHGVSPHPHVRSWTALVSRHPSEPPRSPNVFIISFQSPGGFALLCLSRNFLICLASFPFSRHSIRIYHSGNANGLPTPYSISLNRVCAPAVREKARDFRRGLLRTPDRFTPLLPRTLNAFKRSVSHSVHWLSYFTTPSQRSTLGAIHGSNVCHPYPSVP
jgi:hypothetical protein